MYCLITRKLWCKAYTYVPSGEKKKKKGKSLAPGVIMRWALQALPGAREAELRASAGSRALLTDVSFL